MRKILCLSAFFVLFATAPVQAQTEPLQKPETMAIRVFDVQKVASQSEFLKAARAEIDKKFGKQKSDLEKERDSIEKKAVEFQRKKPTEKQQQALAKQHREYTEKTQAFMKLLQAEEVRVRQDLEKIIQDAAKDVAVKKGYLIILDRAAAPHFDSRLDVTDQMLEEVNAKAKAAPAQQ